MKKKLRGIEKYKPIDNPVTKTSQFDRVPEGIPDNRVWTIVEGDDGDKLYAVAGYHYVNQLYYIVTERPWQRGDENFLWA